MQDEIHVAASTYQILNDLIPFLMTAGGVFGTYIAFGRWIKAWIIKGLIDKDFLEDYLFDNKNGKMLLQKRSLESQIDTLKDYLSKELEENKEYAAMQLQNHRERSDEKDEADKKWLTGLQERVEKLQIKVGE